MTPVDSEGISNTLKNLNLTNAEVDKFTKAFKDPEFVKMFAEYAKEVSDPKVKEETDLYLRQIEAEGRGEEVYGKGVMLVVPTEGFVVKTRDQASGTKAFINVCTSDKLEKLRMTPTKGLDGKPGRHVEIPLSLSHKKTGADKGGHEAWVWDFVVHPGTVEVAMATPAIKALLIDTAIENINKTHKVQLQADGHRVLSMKYKGTPEAPKPHVLTVRTNADQQQPGSRITPNSSAPAVASLGNSSGGGGAQAAGSLKPPGPADPQQPNQRGGNMGGRSAFKFPAVPAAANKAAEAASSPSLAPHEAGYRHASGEVTPEWQLVHRGQVDLAEAWGDAGRGLLAAAPPSYPQALVLRLQLPGCTSAAALELEVNRQAVSVVMPSKFKLETTLPFPVDDSRGRAKFDKAKQQLDVTLPTLLPMKPAAPSAALADTDHDDGDVDQGTAAAASAAVVEQVSGTAPSQQQQPPPPTLYEGTLASHASWGLATSTSTSRDVAHKGAPGSATPSAAFASGSCKGTSPIGAEACERRGQGHEGASPAAAAAVTEGDKPAAALTENQRKWAELHLRQQEAAEATRKLQEQQAAAQAQQEQQGQERLAGVASSAPGEGQVPAFEASEAWAGARPGRAFKLGEQGLGYYADTAGSGRSSTAAAAVAQARSLPEAVTLPPRLNSALVDELD